MEKTISQIDLQGIDRVQFKSKNNQTTLIDKIYFQRKIDYQQVPYFRYCAWLSGGCSFVNLTHFDEMTNRRERTESIAYRNGMTWQEVAEINPDCIAVAPRGQVVFALIGTMDGVLEILSYSTYFIARYDENTSRYIPVNGYDIVTGLEILIARTI